MEYNEIDVNAVCFGILCNFQQFCGEERAKEAAALVRKIYEDNKKLLERAGSAEVRAETLEKMVKEYQEVIVPGYREQAEKAERERDEEKLKVDEYAESARAIALWLSAFCDRSLSYPKMISNAARKISVAYADMQKRAEKAEKEREEATKDCAVAKRNHEIERNRRKECETRIRELETQHRTEMCEAGYDCVQIGKVRKEKAEVEEIASNLCDDFTDFVTGGVYNAAPYCANKRPECVNDRGWCNGDNCVCRGFLPKAARITED